MFLIFFLLLFSSTVSLTTIIDQKRFEPGEYQQLSAQNKETISPQEFDAYKKSYSEDRFINWQQITYKVGELNVVGFIITPNHIDPHQRYPTIIYNRSGSGDFGKIGIGEYQMFRYFVDQGYIVFASQYRGVDGGTGFDNYGGDDIQDVIEIAAIARQQSFVDSENMFMFGWARGGMMTYMALKNQVPINAAATIGAISDLALATAEWRGDRKSLRTELSPYIPEFNDDSTALLACISRSAVCWADEIKTPLLLMHGKHDGNIYFSQSRLLAESLAQVNCPHELFLFEGNHELPLHHLDKICAWFDKYKKKS